LVSGETVIYETRLHWIVILGHIVLGCLLLGLPGVIKTGVVSRKTIEMLLNKVESIEVSETAFGRMLGYGTIVVIGTGGTPEPFHKVAHPLVFRSQVQQQIEKLHESTVLDAGSMGQSVLHSMDSLFPGFAPKCL
jgi:uncharacterized membrane protein YdbT with pleckstrin-like domain